jgi:hypothetical protein
MGLRVDIQMAGPRGNPTGKQKRTAGWREAKVPRQRFAGQEGQSKQGQRAMERRPKVEDERAEGEGRKRREATRRLFKQ